MNRYEERFWDQVAFEPNTGCWLWTGSETGKPGGEPYGAHYVHKRRVRAHRYSFALHYTDPGDMCVCHRCDTPLCVNPDHLFLGTSAVNNRDMLRKGRQVRGMRHGSAKLSREDVLEIRGRTESCNVLAAEYGVHSHTIRRARRGDNWKHLARRALEDTKGEG